MIRSQQSLLLIVALTVLGCTQSAPNQFVQLPSKDSTQAGQLLVDETVEEKVEVSSLPVDILWVIDNSASMKPAQDKLSAGLSAFARKFLLKKGTDIQMAVITTDTFVANELWEKYLLTEVYPGTKDKRTPKDFNKAWGADFARLAPSRILRSKQANGLVSRFQSQVKVGTDGIYEERGLADNEAWDGGARSNRSGSREGSPLFRKGSQRVIVFLSDEDDQTVPEHAAGPEPRKLLYRGAYYVGKDQAQADRILPDNFTIDCPASIVKDAEGKDVELAPMSVCLRPGRAMSVAEFKTALDRFFSTLDGSTNPNYLVASIVTKDLSTIQWLRSQVKNEITHERGERYIQLADLVGNGSFSMDIGAKSYAPILEKIGLEIEKRSIQRHVVKKFVPQTKIKLEFEPDPRIAIRLVIDGENGRRVLEKGQFTITRNILTITDETVIKSLKPGDSYFVDSQPGSIFRPE
jgi:hypothetical protein